jgi:hypothetical protein
LGIERKQQMAWKLNLGRAYMVSILAITFGVIWGSLLAIPVLLLFDR